MANHAIRTVVAVTLETIHVDSGFIPLSRNATSNTQTKVLAALKKSPEQNELSPEYWALADEIIDYFCTLENKPEFKELLKKEDGPMYQACIDVAKSEQVTALTLSFAVSMPHLYGKLKPKKQEKLNPLKTETKLTAPGEFLGTINKPDRFFMKLVHVGKHDKTRGGTLFELRDRFNNAGFFYDTPERYTNVFKLGDCFAFHGTPTKHLESASGEKQTIFRNIDVIADTLVIGRAKVDETQDETGGKFVR